MATKTAPTRRQQEAEAAATEERQSRERHDAVGRRQTATISRITALQTERSQREQERHEHFTAGRDSEARAATDRITAIDGEVSHLQAELQSVNGALETVSAEYGLVYSRHAQAQRALVRESCEEALLALDRLFRLTEGAWRIAGKEAQTLERAGDVWGVGELRRLQNQLTNVHAQQDGVAVLHLPHFPDSQA